MFKDSIRLNPAFTEEIKKSIADGKIDSYLGDETLYMTSVIMLHNRVENLKITSSLVRKSSIVDWNVLNLKGKPDVYTFNWIETSDKELIDKLNDATKLTNVENFVKSKMNMQVMVRLYKDANTVNIIAPNFTIELYHFMISFMSMYFPIFEEKPMTAEETDFMRTLSLKTSQNYTRLLGEMVTKGSFKQFALRKELNGFEKKIYTVKLKGAESKVKDLQAKMNTFLVQYRECCKEFEEANYRYLGIKSVCDSKSDRTELEDYLLKNKNLCNIKIEGNHIVFIVKTYLFPYLRSTWKDLDKKGFIYSATNGYTKEEVRMLLNSFMLDNTLKLKMCAYFNMDYFGSDINSCKHYTYTDIDKSLENYVPNTHLDEYNCFGQNEEDILIQIRNGDIISAIEGCINCAKRINVNESFTFDKFVHRVMTFEGKCFVANDGKEMTPKEAIEYLKGLKDEEK